MRNSFNVLLLNCGIIIQYEKNKKDLEGEVYLNGEQKAAFIHNNIHIYNDDSSCYS